MKIVIVTPAAASARTGNRHTAQRYARFLRSGGHDVRILTQWNGEPVDLMIALHARKSHAAMARYRAAHPDAPLVLVLTGTDLYRDLADDRHRGRHGTRGEGTGRPGRQGRRLADARTNRCQARRAHPARP